MEHDVFWVFLQTELLKGLSRVVFVSEMKPYCSLPKRIDLVDSLLHSAF
jgi:hypothetical protein